LMLDTRAHRQVGALPHWPAAACERSNAAVSRARNKRPANPFALASSGIVMGRRLATDAGRHILSCRQDRRTSAPQGDRRRCICLLGGRRATRLRLAPMMDGLRATAG
jgi:hypothetical protein